MSDTPRTDNACGLALGSMGIGHRGPISSKELFKTQDGPFVYADLARELERENAALREELKEANRLLHIWSPESVKARKEAQP